MNDVERELRSRFARAEERLVGPDFAPPHAPPEVVRRTHRRQLTTVVVGFLAAVAVVTASIAGATALIRSSERRIPADPPPLMPGQLEAVPMGTTFENLTVDAEGDLWWVNPALTRFEPASGSTRTFTIADDPAFSRVWPLASARDGGVWMAQYEGTVYRIDGERIRETLGPGPIWDIAEGPDGTIWATGGEGLVRWDGASWVVVPSGGLPLEGPLTVDADGAVWVSNLRYPGPEGAGVSRFDGSTWTTWTTRDGLPSDYVMTLEVAADGDVWIGTRGGVARFTEGAWVTYTRSETGISNVRSIAATDVGVWIAGWNGAGRQGDLAARFDGASWAPVTVEDGLEVSEFAGTSTDVWATTGAGLSRFDGARWQLALRSSADSAPSSSGPITAVDAGEAWVNPWSDGVWRVEGGVWTPHGGRGLPTDVHDLALADDGTLWAATEGGLARFDGSRWEEVEGGQHTAITFGPDGDAWTASGDFENVSVGRVGGRALPGPVPLDNVVTSLAVLSDDDVWAGSAGGWVPGGLAHFDGRRWVPQEPIGDPEFSVNDIEVAPNGDIWVSLELEPKAAAAGYSLLVARFDGSNWKVYRQDDSVLWDSWPNLDIDAEGRILLATSQGLLEFRQSGWRIVQEGSFAGISIAPDGTIWLSGDGVFRLPSS